MSADIAPKIRAHERRVTLHWLRTHGRTFGSYLRFWRIDASQLTHERRERLETEWRQTRARMRHRAAQLAA